LYKYKQSNNTESDACSNPSTQLPKTITGLQEFMYGFRPTAAGGDLWGNIRIGFNSDPVSLVANASQEAYMRKFWIKRSPLQRANTMTAGWLYLSHPDMHPDDTAERANAFIRHLSAKNGLTPIEVAFERRMIWDTKAKPKEMSNKEKAAKRALHVICERGLGRDAMAFMRKWLRSRDFRSFTSIPMKFIPQFERGYGRAYEEKFTRAVQKHMQLTTFGLRSTTLDDFDHLDSHCETLPNQPTLRRLLLAMTTRAPTAPPGGETAEMALDPPAPKPLFLAVDPATKHGDLGSFVITYTVENAPDAEEHLRHLLSYLIHEHGDAATYWFSSMAIERADEVEWDTENNRPITIEEMDLDALLDDDIDWTANLSAVDISFAPSVEKELARPSRLQKVSNNPLQGENDSVGTFYRASDLSVASNGDTSDNHSTEDGEQLQAEGSSGPSAGAV
jgi:hypothetical protein